MGRGEREYRYVGETEDLQDRILHGHMADRKASTRMEAVRKKIAALERVQNGPEVFRRVHEKWWFAWEVVEDPDMRRLVERLLIAWLRAEGQPLLNDPASNDAVPIDIDRLMAKMAERFPAQPSGTC
jgi:hypothetical protein